MKIFKVILGVIVFTSSGAFGEWEPVIQNDKRAELEKIRDEAMPKELRRTSVSVTSQSFLAKVQTLDQWTASLSEGDVKVLCVGESHDKRYRTFVAQHLLPKLNFATLALEMKESEVASVLAAAQRGEEVPWLGAPIGDVIRAAQASSPQAVFFGLEANDAQRRAQSIEGQLDPVDRQLSRDGFLALNFLERYVPEKLNVILYGSNHCAKQDLALFDRTLMKRLLLKDQSQFKSVLLLPRANLQNPLVGYLSTLKLPPGTLVLENLSELDPAVFNDRFEVMKYQQNFDTIVLFQDR